VRAREVDRCPLPVAQLETSHVQDDANGAKLLRLRGKLDAAGRQTLPEATRGEPVFPPKRVARRSDNASVRPTRHDFHARAHQAGGHRDKVNVVLRPDLRLLAVGHPVRVVVVAVGPKVDHDVRPSLRGPCRGPHRIR